MDKIGLHIIGGYAGPLGRPPVVKLVDASVEYVRQTRAIVGPDCLIVVRKTGMPDNLANPEGLAESWFGTLLPYMRAANDPLVAFEFLNEIDDPSAPLYTRATVRLLFLMHSYGLRSVVGNWSVGRPDFPTWVMYEPMLFAMYPSDLVGLHEYWYDQSDIDNRWHCARWTKVPQLVGKSIVITECGRDRVEAGVDDHGLPIFKGKPGWQLTCGPAEFLGDLRKYGALVGQFSGVVGVAVFQTGSIDRNWKHFEVSAIWPQVVSEYGGTPVTEPTGPPLGILHPLRKPRITQRFGANDVNYAPAFPGHPGLDYGCVVDTVVRAPCSGKLHIGNPLGAYKAYGTHLWLETQHKGKQAWVILAHLDRVLEDEHALVEPGDIVALSGNTGRSTAPHLHMGVETKEVNQGYKDVFDPTFYWADPETFML